jgi:hypothetical protein
MRVVQMAFEMPLPTVTPRASSGALTYKNIK